MKSVFLIAFLDIFSLALLIPVAPVHLLKLGGSRFHVGLLASIHALLQLLIGPLVGSLSDTKGRKPLLVRLGVFTLISNALFFVPGSLTLYFASRILFGLSGHAQILVKALISDKVPKEKQNDAFGKVGALYALSFVFGPLAGGFLYSLPGGFYYIAIVLTSISALNIAISATLPNENPKAQEKLISTKSKKKKQSAPPKQETSLELFRAFSNLKTINWSLYWDVFTFKFLGETNNVAFFSSFGIMVTQEFERSQQELAYVISFFSSVMIISSISIGKIKAAFYSSDTYGFKRNLHAFVILTLLFTFMYLKATFWIYVAACVPYVAFRTVLDSTWTEMLVSRASQADRGKIMGTFESITHMAGLLTPIITGYVGETYGYRTTFILSIIPLFIGSVIGNLCYVNSKAKIAKGKKTN